MGVSSRRCSRIVGRWWSCERSSRWLCVPASRFSVHPHPSTTTRGGAILEVGWAAHIRGCLGRRFDRFGVRDGFRSFWRPFAFVFASVVRRRTGVGYSRRLAMYQGRFHGVHGPGWRSLTWVHPFPYTLCAIVVPTEIGCAGCGVTRGDGRRWWG